MSFSVGQQVGRYRLTATIGQGGMATVYKAYDASLDRDVAIKVMHQTGMDDPSYLARFRREAQIVAKLRHPNIVAIHEFDEHQGKPYLVMEYIAGETLKARLARQPYTLEKTLNTISLIAQALTYAHELGILHRDIKPSNILLDEAGNPYLTDFGLARLVSAGESTLSRDMMLGTPQYISPEQAQGIKNLGPSTDIYSLGVVLFRLVVGRVPFDGDTPFSIVHDHIYKPLPSPSQLNPQVPPEIEMVLHKALSKEPASRFSTAIEMIEDFQTAIEASASNELSPSLVQPPAPAAPLDAQPGMISHTPPSPAIPAVISPDSVTASIESTIRRRQKRARTLWMLGGLSAFIFICLLGLLIFIVTLTDPYYGAVAIGVTNTPVLAQIQVGLSVEEAAQLVEESPQSPEAYFALGLALLENNNQASAQEAVAQGIQLADNNAPLIATAARSTARLGYKAEAIILYIQAMDCAPNDLVLRTEAGAYMYSIASNAVARDVTIFSRIAETYSNFAGIQAMHARALIEIGRFGEASDYIGYALELDDSQPETHLIHGELYYTTGQTEEAEEAWNTAMNATDTPAWVVERASFLLDNLEP